MAQIPAIQVTGVSPVGAAWPLERLILAMVSDGVLLSDGSIPSAKMMGITTDGLSLSDLSNRAAIFSANVSDGIVFSDAHILSAEMMGTAAGTAGFTDSASCDAVIKALASSGVVLSDNAQTVLRQFVSAADAIELSDSGSVNATFKVECKDTAEFAGTVSAMMGLIATLSDGVSFKDSVLKISMLPSGKVCISLTLKNSVISFVIGGAGISTDVNVPSINMNIRGGNCDD